MAIISVISASGLENHRSPQVRGPEQGPFANEQERERRGIPGWSWVSHRAVANQLCFSQLLGEKTWANIGCWGCRPKETDCCSQWMKPSQIIWICRATNCSGSTNLRQLANSAPLLFCYASPSSTGPAWAAPTLHTAVDLIVKINELTCRFTGPRFTE